MPDDLNTSIAFLKERVDKTLAVQTQIAADWLWDEKTVAQWQADSEQLDVSVEDSVAAKAIEADTEVRQARGRVDTRLDAIHTMTVAAVGVMRQKAQRRPEIAPVVNQLSARGDSRGEIENEGMRCLSAWKKCFGGDTWTPGGGVTYAKLREYFYGSEGVPPVKSLRELKEERSDAETDNELARGALDALLVRAQGDCQAWYATVTSLYAEGTTIGDLVRDEVPVTSDYNPPGGGTPPPPTPPTP